MTGGLRAPYTLCSGHNIRTVRGHTHHAVRRLCVHRSALAPTCRPDVRVGVSSGWRRPVYV
eukprot:2389385-Prymnesium_polylepis.1